MTLPSRELPLPDGTKRPFTGSTAMWKALDFLIVCGKWSRQELAGIALDVQDSGAGMPASGLLPKAHGKPGPVSLLELQMLEGLQLEPAFVRPIAVPESGPGLTLDECLHNVVARLYGELQQRLG